MKRHGRDLESETDGNHYQGGDQQRIRTAGGEFASDAGQVEFTGEAVNVTETEKEECGGHSAEEKIFQGSFCRTDALLVESGHRVKTEAEKFQGDENHQQIFRADEEHHRNGGEEQKCEKLTGMIGKI